MEQAQAMWRHRIGKMIVRAIALSGMTAQELSYQMGYQDSSTLSRWVSGKERPCFDKLFAVDAFYDAWVFACAEGNPRAKVKGYITLPLRRSA